jgi:outer membrane protein assembly factor BamB
VFGVSATSGQLRALHPDMTEAFMPLTLGNQAVTAAPSVGPTAIWVASGDGRVYAVALDGSGILNGSGCDTLSATVGVPALFGVGRDVALVGSTAMQALYAVRVTPSLCAPTPAGEAFASSAAVATDGSAYAMTRAGTGSTTLRRYKPTVGDLPAPAWMVAAGTSVLAPLSLDGQMRVIVCSQDGTLLRATDQGTSGLVSPLTSLPAQAEASPVVLSGGDVVVGLAGGSVHRLADNGTALWTSPPDVGDSVRGLAALSTGLDGADVVATTALGEIAALRLDGTVAWSGRPTTAALSFPAVADAAAGGLPTAYAGSQDGKLYAIVVDGPLDAAAPWPKAHHDLANTANASSPLP